MNDALSRSDIRNVVVILAGSRTGSSFLFKALAHRGDFLAPSGEETVFYRHAGLGNFDGKDYSDAIQAPTSSALDLYFEAFKKDTGLHLPNAPVGADCFAPFWHRLSLQWPKVASEQRMLQAQRIFELTLSSSPKTMNWEGLYKTWIIALKVNGLPVTLDLFSTQSNHPQELTLNEEPPYITPVAQIPISKQLAESHTVLLKTSTSIYRLPFLRALFPNARLRWIVLKRNPAATISALMDSWLSSAFHSHNVHPYARLAIQGYSDQIPSGDRYWKLDMPPGWQKYITSPLEDVCAFQWSSAYQHIYQFLNSEPCDFTEVNYENLLNNPERMLQELLQFAGVTRKVSSPDDVINPVGSVHPPEPGKWKKRGPQILSLLQNQDDNQLLKLAERLNYNIEAPETWL